ncbi:MAG TPA: hypothetical protein VN238_05850 [Solirubrobacteraceae bacterium]|nr:hypothetical protein [Solirubrobacteraceae bacterium]
MRIRAVPLVAVLAFGASVGACGGDGDDGPPAAAATTTATTAAPAGRANDCPMSADDALALHRLLDDAPERKGSSVLLLQQASRGRDDGFSRTDESPVPRRHVFVLVNTDQDAVLGLVGRSGDRRVSLTAARGCGAFASQPDEGPARVTFTSDGKVVSRTQSGG